MRIHSLSRIIAIPIAAIAVIAFFYVPKHDYILFYYLLIPLMLLSALYVSYPYIDYWWHTKYPIPLDEELINWLNKYSKFYQGLDNSDKDKFEYRLGLYLEAREFKMMGSELQEVPEDIKAMLAIHAIMISFMHKDFLIGDYDRIYMYKHPFPTPKKQFLHTVEAEHEDGMIIVSLEHLLVSIIEPEKYYNVAMHGYAEAFVAANPTLDYPVNKRSHIEAIEDISGMSLTKIQKTIGYKEIDLLYVLINLYFTFPNRFQERLPDEFAKFHVMFGTIALPQ